MVPRRIAARIVGFALVFSVMIAPAAGASFGEMTVDPQAGTATWSATVECEAGSQVEFDLYIRQGSTEAFANIVEPCANTGQTTVVAQSYVEDGSGRLHPGPATVRIHRRDHVYADGQFEGTVPGGQWLFDVKLRRG